jgi:ATP-dependent helicase/nuclease subunit A
MDSFERQQALNCEQSFIVQAPAGSGKTELLTQRYLALLARVEDPQAILALTFTKKAAQEMRHRILQALQDAASDLPLKNAHQSQTRDLAKAALKQNQTLEWDLLQKPQQLRITTFDAFCLELYQALPQAQEASIPNISNFPEYCYRRAITNWFDWCREDANLQDLIKPLLQQMDYKPNKLFMQLLDLLKTRDQWLHPLQEAAQQSQQDHLDLFARLIESYYKTWPDSLPPNLQAHLLELSQKMASIRPDRYPNLGTWTDFSSITKAQIQELYQLLLTSQQEFRKGWNHHVGLQAEFYPKAQLKELQAESQDLLTALADQDEFKKLILQLAEFPDPKQPEMNWPLLQSYYQLLPLLIAHLHLEFAQQGSCDFIYIAQQALYALEESDLSLQLDQELQHLLVDEFQDTSELQHQLLTLLTQDWEQEPQKTIFVVGDPMQSIYRFRAAKVGIFLQVQQLGLGRIKLLSLQLKQNFRSAPELVNHLNQLCEAIFPQDENIHLGAVGFHPAYPALNSQSGAQIVANYTQNTEEQTQKILDILEEAKQENPKTIAILVRSRRQIAPIIEALEAHAYTYQGLDLKPISQNRMIRDLWILTKVLIHPGHRTHELALMRSPFIGLGIEELHLLANLHPKKSLLTLILDSDLITHLPLETQQRLAHFSHIMEKAKRQLFQLPFLDVLYQLCLDLQLHLIYPEHENTDLQEQYFKILEQFSDYHAWPNWQMIEDYLNHYYISSHEGLFLQIMTMHKSKGLEFDWVIIPNMGDGPRSIQSQALMWIKEDTKTLFLAHEPKKLDNAQFYRFREQAQEAYETQRLAYVAFTRAKHRLYLLDDKPKAEKASFRSLFPLDFFQMTEVKTNTSFIPPNQQAQIKRLPLELYLSHLPESKPSQTRGKPSLNSNYSAQKLGIITHKMLQWICQHHPLYFDEIPWHLAKNQLRAASLPVSLVDQIQSFIHKFWHCPIGQWIRSPHELEANELPLLVKDQHITRQLILDRCFVDQGKFWIIDFKTGHKDETMHPKYQVQLNRYAQSMQKLKPEHPIHCGLYYLGHLAWETWAYNADNLSTIDQYA